MNIEKLTAQLVDELQKLDINEQIQTLNEIRRTLHDAGPFANEPVDLVIWHQSDAVKYNDYNPNSVAPPEMALLKKSIDSDGYTQPIVVYPENEQMTIVDGYHRSQVGKSHDMRKKLHGYLPVTEIRSTQAERSNRIASTIRHNRARGSHAIDLMVGIVGELIESGMSDAWIMKNIGMDADELLRLKQVSGLAALFKDKTFTQAWAKNEKDAEFYES